jgi:hypothetical protein
VKPDSFAAVMATGIVSIAAVDHGYRAISDVLIVLAAVALPVLVVAAATSWRRESWNLANLDVSLRLCTYIAACAVLGARLAEHRVGLWLGTGQRCDVRIGDPVCEPEDRLPHDAVLGHRYWRVHLDDGTDRLASRPRSGRGGVGAARHLDTDGWRGDRDVGGRSHPQGRAGGRLAGDGRDVVRRDGVDPAADLRHPATVSEATRTSVRAVVGGGVSTRDVLVGDVRHCLRNR